MLLWLCGLKEEKRRGFWKKMCKCRQHCFHHDRLSSTVYNCFPQDESIGRSIILCNVLNLFSREDQWLRRGLTEENYLLTNKQATRRSHKGRLKGRQYSHRQASSTEGSPLQQKECAAFQRGEKWPKLDKLARLIIRLLFRFASRILIFVKFNQSINSNQSDQWIQRRFWKSPNYIMHDSWMNYGNQQIFFLSLLYFFTLLVESNGD